MKIEDIKSITCAAPGLMRTIQQQTEEGWEVLSIVPSKGGLKQVNWLDLLQGKKDELWEWVVTEYRIVFQRCLKGE